MKLIRSDSPEVDRSIASIRVQASRHLPILLLALLPNLAILAIALVCLIISVRAAAWISLPAFLAWNAWMLWRARSPRLSWVIKTRGERIYIRLFVGFGKAWKRIDAPDVIVLEASEIVSMSIRSVEVLLYGPKLRIVEWLMIEPTQAVAESVSDQIPSFLANIKTLDLGERVYWAKEERRLVVGWKWCHPAVRLFLQQVAQACPSVVIDREERSELDLNGIWNGSREKPNAQQRQMLIWATCLGFGCKCVELLSLHRGMTRQEAAEYLAEIEREECGTEQSAGCSTCRF
jgi:hypothetical protein